MSNQADYVLFVHIIVHIIGGSGLAPMLQLLRAKTRDSDCDIETCLLFANRREQDILLRDELERLHAAGTISRLWYTLDEPPSGIG
jgi:NAD(P)H-flavin reductase